MHKGAGVTDSVTLPPPCRLFIMTYIISGIAVLSARFDLRNTDIRISLR